jgi:hypothetical protein
MAKQPFFASAPRLQLLIDGTRVGYAIGLTLNISVTIEPVKVLGMFETLSLEPLAYLPVSGSMRIIKLLPKTVQTSVMTAANTTKDKFVDSDLSFSVNNLKTATSMTDQSLLYSHVTPGAILISRSFDVKMTIKRATVDAQKTIDDAAKAAAGVLSSAYTSAFPEKVADATVAASAAYQKLVNDKYDAFDNLSFYESSDFLTVKDCRITGMDSEISPARLMEEAVSFQGLLVINQYEAMDYIKDLV